MNRGAPADEVLIERRRRSAEAMLGSAAVPGVAVADGFLGGIPVRRCRPDSAKPRVILWFHGGGYRLGSAQMFTRWTSNLAVACAAEVVSVDYRLAPEHPFPDALIDALLAYQAALAPALPILIGGDSAGGGLAAALLLALAERELLRPKGAVLLSPWLDMRVNAASFTSNADTDQLFSANAAREGSALLLAGHPAADPLVTPVLGNWAGLPPVLVQASTTEVLRDDALALAKTAPCVRLELYEDLPHVWHLGYPEAPGSVAAVDSIAYFVEEVARA